MATVDLARSITTEELLAMPDDGVERWIVRGQLREKPMTIRNRIHSEIMVNVSTELSIWVRSQPEPRGAVVCGEAGVRLGRDPDTTYGVDVAYISPEVANLQTDESAIVDGVPTLVVEILSPSDTQEEIHEKKDDYLRAGVRFVWILDPYDPSVTVYQANVKPKYFTLGDEIAADPWLPGFRVSVDQIFGGRFQTR